MSSREQVLQMTMGFAISHCIYAAVKLGIADYLSGRKRNCYSLAIQTGTHPQSLYRLMRALAGVGIFAETEPCRFEMTPAAEYLKSDVSSSLREFILLRGEVEFALWGEFIHTLKTGKSAFEKIYGSVWSEYLMEHPKTAERYNRAMAGISIGENNEAIMSACDFSGIDTLVLVGGDQAMLFEAILTKYPNIEGILMETGESADVVLKKRGRNIRYTYIKGDCVKSLPPIADAYLIGFIHALSDDKAVKVLKNCYDVMPTKSRLFIVERMIAAKSPWRVSFADMNMLVMTGGGIRTKEEFFKLFKQAGIEKTDFLPTKSVMNVIRAEKK